MAGNLLQTLLSLGLVLGLIFGLAWLTRRLQKLRGGRTESMQIESGLQLGAKERLLLVNVHGQQFLIGVAPGTVNLMHRFPPASANGHAEIIPFAQHLKKQP